MARFFVLIFCVPLLASCSTGPRQPDLPDVVLITADALRADHVGAYGYHRNITPHIDAFARHGIRFEQAYCPIPRTVPSLASLHTGVEPKTHGVRANLFYTLSDDWETLAEVLGSLGYQTAAFAGNPLVTESSGLLQGFPPREFAPIWKTRRANALHGPSLSEQLTDRALEWLKENHRAPIFLWVHYLDPHMPYTPLKKDIDFLDPGYAGRLAERLDLDWFREEDLTYDNPLTPRERDRAVALYDAEIREVDRQIGRLLDHLDGRLVRDDSLIIITADHGESLGEHDYFYNHGDYLYEPSARIPLVCRALGSATASIVSTPVDLLDVHATIRARAGLPPAGKGRNLLGKNGIPVSLTERLLFAESGICFDPLAAGHPVAATLGDRDMSEVSVEEFEDDFEEICLSLKLRSLHDGTYKLVFSPNDPGPRWMLFQPREDPGETSNLYPLLKDTPEVQTLRKWLKNWMARHGARSLAISHDPDPGKLEALRSLGYVK